MFNLSKSFSDTFQGLTLDRLQEGAVTGSSQPNPNPAEAKSTASPSDAGAAAPAASSIDATKALFGAWFQGADQNSAVAKPTAAAEQPSEELQRLRKAFDDEHQMVESLQQQLISLKDQLRQTQPEPHHKLVPVPENAEINAQSNNQLSDQQALIITLQQQLYEARSQPVPPSTGPTLASIQELLLAERNVSVDLRQQLQDTQGNFTKVKSEMKQLAERLRDMIKKTQEKQKQIQLLEAELQSLKDEQQTGVNRATRELHDQLLQRNNEVTAMKSDLLTKNSVNAAQETQIKKLTEDLRRVTQDLARAQETSDTASQSLQQQQTLLADVQNAIAERSEAMERENEQLKGTVRTLEESFAEEKTRLETEVQSLKASNQELTSRFASVQRHTESDSQQLQLLRQETEEKEQRLKQLTKQLESQRTAVDNFDSYKKRAQATLKQTNDKLAELTCTYEDLKAHFDALETQSQTSKSRETELLRAVETLEGREATLRDTMAHLQSKVQLLKSENEQLLRETAAAATNKTTAHQPPTTNDYEEDDDYHQPALPTQSVLESPVAPMKPKETRQHTAYAVDEPEYVEVAGVQMHVAHPESDGTFLLEELRQQLDTARKEASRYAQELTEARHTLRRQEESQAKLVNELEDIKGFSARQQALGGDSDNAGTNLEYLKNCVLQFMVSKDRSEKQRMSPVIATILRFTSDEKHAVEQALSSSKNSSFRLTSWGV